MGKVKKDKIRKEAVPLSSYEIRNSVYFHHPPPSSPLALYKVGHAHSLPEATQASAPNLPVATRASGLNLPEASKASGTAARHTHTTTY